MAQRPPISTDTLRRVAGDESRVPTHEDGNLIADAADEIDRLRAEVERLRADADRLRPQAEQAWIDRCWCHGTTGTPPDFSDCHQVGLCKMYGVWGEQDVEGADGE